MSRRPTTIYGNIEVWEHCFFGFHDKCPWSADGSLILAHRADDRTCQPKRGDRIAVGVIHDGGEFEQIAETRAWNWQQGSMLQWLGNGRTFIFNDICDKSNRSIAQVVDVDSRAKSSLPYPVGACSPDGSLAATYSFERLRIGMPGYEYASDGDTDAENPIASEPEGALRVFESESGRLVHSITLEEMASRDVVQSMDGAYHFFTHTLFSPDGSRLLFFHRWKQPSRRVETRLYILNIATDELVRLDAGPMISHFTWVGNDQILAYCEDIEGDDGYHLFDSGGRPISQIGRGTLNVDGHPQARPGRRVFVSDTYPNRHRIQTLFTYDLDTDERRVVAEIRSPFRFRGEIRVDLHPRWNRDGSRLCIDTSHTGVRSLAVVGLEE